MSQLISFLQFSILFLLISACTAPEEKQPIVKKVVKEIVVPDVTEIIEAEEVIPTMSLNDTITVEGILLSIDESDFWGRIYLTMDIKGEKKSFTYLTYSIDLNKEVEKLINKKVALKYYSEVTIEEIDIHFNGSGIHGNIAEFNKRKIYATMVLMLSKELSLLLKLIFQVTFLVVILLPKAMEVRSMLLLLFTRIIFRTMEKKRPFILEKDTKILW